MPPMACRALIVPSMDLSFVVAANGLAGFDRASDGSACSLGLAMAWQALIALPMDRRALLLLPMA